MVRISCSYNLSPGIQVKLINNKQQTVEYTETVWGESSEQTVVYYQGVSVTYQISSEYSSWILTNVTNYNTNLVTADMIATAVRAASATLETNVVTNRNYILPAATERLQEKVDELYPEGAATILQVLISNADFEDAYNQAIADRQAAQIAYEQAQIDNQTAIEKAEADATVTKTTAQAEADALLIQAQAEADALLIEAEAEATANELLTESLTDKILQQQYIEKWDGALPRVSLGEEASTMIDVGNLADDSSTTEVTTN